MFKCDLQKELKFKAEKVLGEHRKQHLGCPSEKYIPQLEKDTFLLGDPAVLNINLPRDHRDFISWECVQRLILVIDWQE